MKTADVVTIPKRLTGRDDLVVLTRKEYERLIDTKTKDKAEGDKKKETVTEDDVLRWSREAKKLKRAGKLSLFEGFIKMEYPQIAKKYHLR